MSVRLHLLARFYEWLGLPDRAARVRDANDRRAKGREM